MEKTLRVLGGDVLDVDGPAAVSPERVNNAVLREPHAGHVDRAADGRLGVREGGGDIGGEVLDGRPVDGRVAVSDDAEIVRFAVFVHPGEPELLRGLAGRRMSRHAS